MELANVYLCDSEYNEQYVDELIDTTCAVQTDLALGVRLQSESLNSLPDIPEDENTECTQQTELPWRSIALLTPGTYVIRSTKILSTEEESPLVEGQEERTDDDGAESNEPLAAQELVEEKPEDVHQSVEETPEGVQQSVEEMPEGVQQSVEEMPEEVTEINTESPETDDVVDIEKQEDLEEKPFTEDDAPAQDDLKENSSHESSPKSSEVPDASPEEQQQELIETVETDEGREVPQEESDEEHPIDEHQECDEKSIGKTILIYEHSGSMTYHEPYMECLTRLYPPDKCTSRTEMPWTDILLPTNVKIRDKRKKLVIIDEDDCTGMFIPTQEDDECQVVVELNVGNEACAPNTTNNCASSPAVTYAVSAGIELHCDPTVSPKEYVLHIDLDKSDVNVGFQDEKGNIVPVPLGAEFQPSATQKLKVTAGKKTDNQSSVMISIKSSGEISAKQTATTSTVISVVEPLQPVSSTDNNACGNLNCSSSKPSKSMPEIPSKKSIKATVSFKSFLEKEEVLLDHETKLNIPKIKIPLPVKTPSTTLKASEQPEKCSCKDELKSEPSTNSNLKADEQQNKQPEKCNCKEEIKSKPSTDTTLKADERHCEQPVKCSCKDEIKPKHSTTPALKADKEKSEQPEKCICKDEVKPDSFKPDMVMQALDSYEAEMKPLKQTLTQLQQKIRSLNISEIKGCSCTLTPSQAAPTTLPARSTHPQHTVCPHYNPPSFDYPNPLMSVGAAPARPSLPPALRVSPYEPQMSSFMQMPPSSSLQQPYPYQSPPPSVLAMQARQYGMLPDFRGRCYSPNEMPYQNYHDYDIPKERISHLPEVTKHLSANYSFNECPSYAVEEKEQKVICPFIELARISQKGEKHRSEKSRHGSEKKHCRTQPSRSHKKDCDYNDDLFRSGKGIRTDPSQFIKSNASSGSGSHHVLKKSPSSKVSVRISRKHH